MSVESDTNVDGLELFGGEELLYDIRPSWSRWGNHILAGVLTIWLGVGVLILLYVFLQRQSTRYFVTNHRVMERTGLLGQYTLEHRISDLKWLKTGRNWIGKYTGTGRVEASSGGGSSVTFAGISDYNEVADSIREHRQRLAA